MTKRETAALRDLARSWADFVHAQGTETEVLAHEAWMAEKCRTELLELVRHLEGDAHGLAG